MKAVKTQKLSQERQLEDTQVDIQDPEELSSRDKEVRNLFRNINYWEEYFCGADVGLYIGPVWVDDIVSIQYSTATNKSPMHGYMSEKFDAVARGSYVVEGQFAIAYREANYLPKILYKFKEMQSSVGKDNFIATGIGSANLRELFGESDFDNVKKGEVELKNQIAGEYGKAFQFGYNKDPYNKSIDRAGFDIYLTFGDVSETHRGGTAVVLNNCHITSQSMVVQTTGEPIAEVYTFFARDINDIPNYKYFFVSKNVEIQGMETTPQELARQSQALFDYENEFLDIESNIDEMSDEQLTYRENLIQLKSEIDNLKQEMDSVFLNYIQDSDLRISEFNAINNSVLIGKENRIFNRISEKADEYQGKYEAYLTSYGEPPTPQLIGFGRAGRRYYVEWDD